MLPIEHFIVAIVPVSAYVLVRDRRLPHLRLVGIVFVGSQLPDLIDKPLAHQLGLIPTGRVLFHSLPIAIPVICVVGWYALRTNRTRAGGAFAFAYLSHIVADNYRALLPPDPTIPNDMVWPFRPAIPRPTVPYWAGPESINIHLWTVFSVTVLSVTAYYVYLDIAAELGDDKV